MEHHTVIMLYSVRLWGRDSPYWVKKGRSYIERAWQKEQGLSAIQLQEMDSIITMNEFRVRLCPSQASGWEHTLTDPEQKTYLSCV